MSWCGDVGMQRLGPQGGPVDPRLTGPGAFQVAATYIGTVVGAGFASGQEVMRFFTHVGPDGIYGLLVSTLLFVLYGALILATGRRLQATSHGPVVREAAGPWLGGAIDIVMTTFLFAGLAVMIAGSAAIFQEYLRLPGVVGSCFMAVTVAVTVLFGMKGVLAVNAVVVPTLLLAVLTVSLSVMWGRPLGPEVLQWARPEDAAARGWLISATLYVSYNLLLSLAVMAPLGGMIKEPRRLVTGALLGGLALGMAATAIHLALLLSMPEALEREIPMLYAARGLPIPVQGFYTLVLWAEVYTTAVGSLYGLAVRLTSPESPKFSPLVIAAAGAGLVASRFGFSAMVSSIYPLVGYAGLLFMIALPVWFFRRPSGNP